MLSTHYRRPLDFSDEQLTTPKRRWAGFYRLFERIERITGENMYAAGQPLQRLHVEAGTDAQKSSSMSAGLPRGDVQVHG